MAYSPRDRTGTALALSGLLVATLASQGLALAQPITVEGEPLAPLVPSFTPRQPVEIATRFQQALASGLDRAPWRVIDPAKVRDKTRALKAHLGCGDEHCVQASQRALAVDYAATARIDVVGKNYTIEVAVYGGQKQLGRANGRCDICTLREALDKTTELTKQAAQLASALVTPARRIESQEKVAVPAPARTTSQPGTPESTATKTSPEDDARRWPLWPALTAAGVAVVGLSIGIPLLAVDGNATDCRGEPRADDRHCGSVYSTSGGGWAMTTIGLASLATAGVLLYLHYATRPEERSTAAALQHLTIAPSGRGVVFGAGGNF